MRLDIPRRKTDRLYLISDRLQMALKMLAPKNFLERIFL
jgi:hypothetical protein